MGLPNEPRGTYAAWAPAEGPIALVERVYDDLASTGRPSSGAPADKENEPRWLLRGALKRFDDREAREAYYARL